MTDQTEVRLPKPVITRYVATDLPQIMVEDKIGAWVRLDDALEYARLAVMEERERCARICEQLALEAEDESPHHNYDLIASDCAAAIREG